MEKLGIIIMLSLTAGSEGNGRSSSEECAGVRGQPLGGGHPVPHEEKQGQEQELGKLCLLQLLNRLWGG